MLKTSLALFLHLFKVYTFQHDGTGLKSSVQNMYLTAIFASLPLFLMIFKGSVFLIPAMAGLLGALLTAFIIYMIFKDTRKSNAVLIAILGINIIRVLYFFLIAEEMSENVRLILIIIEFLVVINVIRKIV